MNVRRHNLALRDCGKVSGNRFFVEALSGTVSGDVDKDVLMFSIMRFWCTIDVGGTMDRVRRGPPWFMVPEDITKNGLRQDDNC